MNSIQIPVALDGLSRKKDRSASIRFTTLNEMSNDDFSELDRRYQDAGWLLFKPNQFNEEEIPEEDVETDIEKSQSVQLRDSLWVLYKAKGHDPADKSSWNQFYRKNMQAIKNKVLAEVHALEEKLE